MRPLIANFYKKFEVHRNKIFISNSIACKVTVHILGITVSSNIYRCDYVVTELVNPKIGYPWSLIKHNQLQNPCHWGNIQPIRQWIPNNPLLNGDSSFSFMSHLQESSPRPLAASLTCNARRWPASGGVTFGRLLQSQKANGQHRIELQPRSHVKSSLMNLGRREAHVC